jgi:histidyl-tRNA synthetase
MAVEVYPDPKKLGQQLKYADSRGFPVAVIAGEKELSAHTCQVKELLTGHSREVSTANQYQELIDVLRQILRRG